MEANVVRMREGLAVSFGLMLTLILCLSSVSAGQQSAKKAPEPKLIVLDPNAKDYMRVLGGPPETITMHSGLVVLEPEKSVGTHNTKNYEEVLVVLEGAGKMVITGGPTLQLRAGTVAYCPPRTEHNVICEGPGRLRYVYIVANAE
jgi:quercetin dioxygenase-like cupin family protein